MPLYTREYRDVAREHTLDDAIRRYLGLIETDLRETSLLALAAWHDAGLPADAWKAAAPNLFRVVAGLQEPSFGRWNGLLHALREALTCVGKRPEGTASPVALEAILDWLRKPAEPEIVEALRAMAPLLHFALPGKVSRWDSVGLSVCLRNRLAHDQGFDEGWWSTITPAVAGLASAFAALPPCLDRTVLAYPSPWFIERGGVSYAYAGIRGNDALYHALGLGTLSIPLSETELIAGLQQVLGQAEVQQASFRELMKRHAPEEVKGVLAGDFLLGPPAASGGFAVVHRGYQLSVERKVALKVLPDGLSASKRALIRREAERLAAFDTPEIVRLIGFHEDIPWSTPREINLAGEPWFAAFKKGSPFKTFLAMEWVEGEDLSAVYDKPEAERPDDRVLISWFRASAEALAKVHASGLIHMDVTPNNIRVTPEGQVKLMDFGIARSETERQDLMTRTRLGVGTPAYMAPEQFDDQGNRQSDVYSLCATFYELFARARLFDHDRADLAEVNRKKREGIAPTTPRSTRREIPWEVETLLLGGLHAEPGLRPTSRQLADDLRRIEEDRPIKYRKPPLNRRVRLWYRRNRHAVKVAAPALAFLLVASIVLGAFWRNAERGVVSLTKDVATEKTRADAEKRLKLVVKYVGDMRQMPRLWKDARVDQIREVLKPYRDSAGPDLRGFEWYYWDRLVGDSRPIRKVEGRVRSLDWSADGRTLFAADASGAVLAWDRSSTEPRVLLGPESASIVVESSPTGALAVLADPVARGVKGPSTWKVIDPSTLREEFNHASKSWAYRGAAFSPDGRRLLTSDTMGGLFIWDLQSGQKPPLDLLHNPNARRSMLNPRQVMDAHDGMKGAVHAVAFSPDGTLVATGGDDGAVGLWHVGSGRSQGWFREHKGRVASVAFGKDGRTIVSRSLPRSRTRDAAIAAPGEILVWSLPSLATVRRLPLPEEVFEVRFENEQTRLRDGNYRAEFLRDDRLVAAGVGTVVRVWDVGTGELARDFKGHLAPIVSLAAAPDGVTLASGDENGEVRTWGLADSSTEEVAARFDAPARGLIPSADGSRVVALLDLPAGTSSDATVDFYGDRRVATIRADEGPGVEFESGQGLYGGLATSPGRRLLATFETLKHELVVWDAASGRVVKSIPHPEPSKETRPGASARTRAQVGPFQCLAFRSDDEIVYILGGELWRAKVGAGKVEPLGVIAVGSCPRAVLQGEFQVPSDAVMALAFSGDGRLAAAGTAGRSIVVYDTSNWKEIARLSRHTRGVTGLAFSDDSRRLASCSGRYYHGSSEDANLNPGEVILWDTTTWQDTLTLTLAEPSEFGAVGFADAGRSVYASANQVEIAPGKLAKGSVVRWATGPAAPISAAASGSRSTLNLAPASGASKARTSKTAPASGTPKAGTAKIQGFSAGLYMGVAGAQGLTSVAVHPTGELVAATTILDALMLWDARTGEIVSQAKLDDAFQPGWQIRFTADGNQLICGANGGRLVSVRSVPRLAEATAQVETLDLGAFSGGSTRVVRLGGGVYKVPDYDLGAVATFSQDGRLVALAEQGGSPRLRVGSLETMKPLFSASLDGTLLSAGFSRDGKVAYAVTRPVATADGPRLPATFQRWAVSSGEPLGSVPGLVGLQAISPDLERCLELADGGELYARDLASGRRDDAPAAIQPALRGVAFFPDGDRFVTLGGQNWVALWKSTEPLAVPENQLFRASGPPRVPASADGNQIAFDHPSGSLAVFDLVRRETTRFRVEPPWPTGLHAHAFAADGQTLIARPPGQLNHPLVAIDIGRREEAKLAPKSAEVRPPGFDPGQAFPSHLLAVSARSPSEVAYFFKAQIGPVVPNRPKNATSKEPPPYLLWDGREARLLPEIDDIKIADDPRIVPAFSPRGKYLAFCASARGRTNRDMASLTDRPIYVIGVAEGRVVARIPVGARGPDWFGFSADESTLLFRQIETKDGKAADRVTLAAFELPSGRETFRTTGLPAEGLVLAPDGRRIARGGGNGPIVVESVPDRSEVARIAAGAQGLSPVLFLPNGDKLLTWGPHGAVQLWDLAEGKSAAPSPSAVGRPTSREVVVQVERPGGRNTRTAQPAPQRGVVAPAAKEVPPPLARKPIPERWAEVDGELKRLADRLRRPPPGSYTGRLPVLATGLERIAASLADEATTSETLAEELARFIKDAEGLKEEGNARSPYKDLTTTYKERGKGDNLPGYKEEFFRNRREFRGTPFNPAKESPLQYGQRLFAEMILTLEQRIELLGGRLPEPSLLREWEKMTPMPESPRSVSSP